ncbi:metalloregulator ArsR/SmtB family transcription factor [Thermococcus sp.]|uniref:ArsR/SmtB family transcription factor n=1 Tax=Thermococcus sp. TaxID=35749 RepID=UPI003459AA0D
MVTVKVGELLKTVEPGQRRSVEKCMELCDLKDPNQEIVRELNEDVVRFVKLLSNKLRFQILRMLLDRWLCVCLIANALGQDQTLISHHLRSLKSLGLLEERKEGKLRLYRAKRSVVEEYLNMLSSELL